MNFDRLETNVTRTGIVSFAALAVIGIIASIFGTIGSEIDLSLPLFLEDIILFIILVLSILVVFCIPTSFLMKFSSIAAGLVKSSSEAE